MTSPLAGGAVCRNTASGNTAAGTAPDAVRTGFKEAFYADLAAITHHCTVINSAVRVSDAAWAAMEKDPAYREQMLGLAARDLGSSYAPRPASVLIQIGGSAENYRAHSWPVGYDAEFYAWARKTPSSEESRNHRRQLPGGLGAANQAAVQEAAASAALHSAVPGALRRMGMPGAALVLKAYTDNATAALFSGAAQEKISR